MSATRPNPLHIDVIAEGLEYSQSIEDQINKLYLQIKEDDHAREDWIMKQEKLYRQRRGVRRAKTFPWPGANNHSWPLTDAIIRRWKPNMTALVTQAEPVAFFRANNPRAFQLAPSAQDYYHYKFHQIDGMRRTVMELLDYVAQYGMGYTRQGWDYRTEKQCRIVPVQSLFPGGPEAAHQQYLAEIAQARTEIQQAIAAGQAPPEAESQLPPPLPLEQFVTQVLEEEYIVKATNPLEKDQLEVAVQAILNGADTVRFYYQVVEVDRPGWRAISPMDVILPPRCDNPREADRITVIHRLSVDELLKRALDGYFFLDRAQEIASKIRDHSVGDPYRNLGEPLSISRSGLQNVMDTADGISPGHLNEPTSIVLFEIHCKLDINGDKLLERCVLWYHPETKIVLALYPYPMPFKEWPIMRHDFEHLDTRTLSSRGIAELCAVFQAHVTKFHNARLDALQITLSPMFQIRAPSGNHNRNIKFMPGTMIPVTQVGDLAPLPIDTSGIIAALNEENLTKQLAENYVGLFDPTVLSQNAPERRTAAEVEAVVQQTQSIFSQDAELFQDSMAQVHRQLWMLLQEFGPEEEYFRVTGEEQPRLARKHELDDDYDIVPAGTPANTSKALAVARSREALQLFAADNSGLINRHELYNMYFQAIDPKVAKLIVRRPEEAAAIQQLMAILAQTAEEQGQPPESVPLTP